MSARARAFFGTETEYAITAVDRAGQVLPHAEVADGLLERVSVRPSLAAAESGFFLTNGARFYIDTAGHHPEYASAECDNPWDAVLHAVAGDVLMRELAAELCETRSDVASLVIRKGNVDDAGRATWASHENYLHACAPAELRPALIPHLVSRIVFTGSGGIDPFNRRRARFVLSPRATFLRQVVARSSPGGLALVDERRQPHCTGFHRQHLMCGDANWSHLSLFLRLGTTALVVALIDRGVAEAGAVALGAPLVALRTVACDTTLRAEVDLESGSRTTALAIQRHYLRQARLHLRDLPEWAGDVCDLWQDTLHRLAHGPDAVADRLDWAIKRAVFRDQAARRRMGAIPLAAEQLSLLPPRRPSWWRAALCEIDLRFGCVHPPPLFESLDATGLLRHGVPGVGEFDQALSDPPATGRARIRGEVVRRLSSEPAWAVCDWHGVRDLLSRRELDLSSPFADREVWRALSRDYPDTPALVTHLVQQSSRAPSVAASRSIRWLSEVLCAEVCVGGQMRALAPGHALRLNDCAFALRNAGRFQDALCLMRAALGVELAVRPADHPKLAHRRNNLATVLLMLGRVDDARDEVTRAWQATAGRRDLTSARILVIRLAIAMVAKEPFSAFLGQARTHLAIRPLPDFADVSPYWQVPRLLEALSPVLEADAAALLKGLGDVLNNDRPHDSLDEIALWRCASPASLDEPWPRAVAA